SWCVARSSGLCCQRPGLAELDPAEPDPAANSGPVDPAAVAEPDLGSGLVAGAAAAPAGLAAAGSGPWSRPSVRAAIGPPSALACVAAIALAYHARAGSRCPERIGIVGLHRRVALLRLACFGLTPRQLPPIAQPY